MNDQPQCRPAEPSRRDHASRPVPRVGDKISYATLGGSRYRGRVVEMDGNVAHVLCDDGVRRCVEC